VQQILLTALSLGILLGCSGGEREVVVTRDQFGDSWPLEVNSARVLCPSSGDAALLKLGPQRYALTESAREAGYPDAQEVARAIPVAPGQPEFGSWPADISVLGNACNPQVASEG
jgi:hypothetical protein